MIPFLWLSLPAIPPPSLPPLIACQVDVVIVGAGSAGLSAAYELSKHPEIKASRELLIHRCIDIAAVGPPVVTPHCTPRLSAAA